MVAFLFWNLNRKPLQQSVANLMAQREIDVAILCECNIAPTDLLQSLNGRTDTTYRYASGIGCQRVEMFAGFPSEFIRPSYETEASLMDSLWPEDIAVVETKAPVTMLKEQASLLSKQTKGIVEGEVKPSVTARAPFCYTFHIKAPALGDYRYQLFHVTHDVSLYPLLVFPDESIMSELRTQLGISPEEAGITVGDERQLLDVLRLLFASSKTKQVVRAILAQSGFTTALA